MLGLIIVSGDAPATAQLDRPKQKRPKRVGWLEGFAPEMLGAPRGTSLEVFALP